MATAGRVTLHSGYTVLCSAADGSLDGGRHGLFDFDTRILSRHQLTFGGRQPELVTAAQLTADHWRAVLRVEREGGTPEGPQLPQDTIEISVERVVGPVLEETIVIANRSGLSCAATLEVSLDADFADVGGLDKGEEPPGSVDRSWRADGAQLEFRYAATNAEHRLERGLRVLVRQPSVAGRATDSGPAFDLDLPGGASATIRLGYESLVDGTWRSLAPEHARRAGQRAGWRRQRVSVEGDGTLARVFERAVDDLFDLRNWELERSLAGSDRGDAWLLNAGIPTFTGLFGRDTLTAGWQSAMLGPRATLGALAASVATQSTTDEPWRDAEPGKMIHEARRGPLAELGLTPRDAYYGSQTTPQMFLVALAETWLWTADEGILARHAAAGRRGLEWAQRHGDLDGDSLLEYEKRSPKGLRNQGWKDSDEGIRHADGAIAEPHIASVEEQGFYYIALKRMAAIETILGDDEAAATYLRRAQAVRQRFHDAFWMPDEGFYALALDRHKRQVRSITSNPGHALAAGIVPEQHATAVADRLMSPDLFSGWGVRTLSRDHPSFNPLAYHLGTVWPVEQATFALAFKRYGLDDHAALLATSVLEAAEACSEHRLPEAISGHSRAELGHPVSYPDANSPQAWSASATVQLVQVLLGLYPLAPLGVLAVVRPRLPVWAPEVTLRKLRVGRATVDLRFKRKPDGSATHEVIGRRGPVAVVPAGAPQSLDPSAWEAAVRAGLAAAPGRRMSALKILLDIA